MCKELYLGEATANLLPCISPVINLALVFMGFSLFLL